jgi:hypothetical protein
VRGSPSTYQLVDKCDSVLRLTQQWRAHPPTNTQEHHEGCTMRHQHWRSSTIAVFNHAVNRWNHRGSSCCSTKHDALQACLHPRCSQCESKELLPTRLVALCPGAAAQQSHPCTAIEPCQHQHVLPVHVCAPAVVSCHNQFRHQNLAGSRQHLLQWPHNLSLCHGAAAECNTVTVLHIQQQPAICHLPYDWPSAGYKRPPIQDHSPAFLDKYSCCTMTSLHSWYGHTVVLLTRDSTSYRQRFCSQYSCFGHTADTHPILQGLPAKLFASCCTSGHCSAA